MKKEGEKEHAVEGRFGGWRMLERNGERRHGRQHRGGRGRRLGHGGHGGDGRHQRRRRRNRRNRRDDVRRGRDDRRCRGYDRLGRDERGRDDRGGRKRKLRHDR